DQTCSLGNHQRIAIGEYEFGCQDTIDLPGAEVRAYLVRKGEKLYLEPTNNSRIEYQDKIVDKKIQITRSRIDFNCPNPKPPKNYRITIKIQK
ncbi:MAG: VWA domain-containing protein, partial [Planktothrix sp.]